MNWWERFFDEEYASRFMPQEVAGEARQLRDLLQVEAGARVFVQCCGQGGFSRALADLGLLPVGVDANAEYVERARQACAVGRFFCEDARVVSEFQPLMLQNFEDGVRVERHSRLNWEEGLMDQKWVFQRPGQEPRSESTATRMFWPRDLADLLRTAGFEPLELYGDLGGSCFETSSRRLVWVARRP